MAGRIMAGDLPVEKAGQPLNVDTVLTLKDSETRFVSRGGYKLAGALADFELSVTGLKLIDLGASTGGFTDCLLQNGAAHVTAVDVGYGILDWKLRQDARVKVVERMNARHLTAEQVDPPYDMAVIDVSFISLTLILPKVKDLLKPGGIVLAMVKPQFEAGREKVGKGGVVRDPEVQQACVDKVAEAACRLGFQTAGSKPAHIKGPKGNQEFFLLLIDRSDKQPAAPV